MGRRRGLSCQYAPGSASAQARDPSVCVRAGSLHDQHWSDVITTLIHLSKQYQPGVCSAPIPSAG